ncbi:FAD-dependent oxidoreductase [Microbacteriaceae bacterium VKM Ac-2855]|nr:FAD-dependent oxidoreductase [Microbacteriaceae bacterium VKM Ac-2855]
MAVPVAPPTIAPPTIAPPTIAIVGTGPAGCYTAQFLRKQWRDAEITMFERLEQPYGLIRYGVAPDHLGTKAVARQFDRLFERGAVRFVGGTEIGVAELTRLRASYDVVVLATGLPADRVLDGFTLPQVYGSGRLTRLLNAHPEEDAAGLALGERVVIVGHGNVAIDLLRLFLTRPERLRELGIDEDAVKALTAGPVRHIDVVGRSAPGEAKFDAAMIHELADATDVRFEAPPATEAVDALVAASPADATRTVRFHFGWTPERVIGHDRVEGIVFRDADGAALALDADAICTAIGFTEAASAALRRSDHESVATELATGLLDDGLYCVGWLRRGPRGSIPENRADARLVADAIAAAVESGSLPTGKPGHPSLDLTHSKELR